MSVPELIERVQGSLLSCDGPYRIGAVFDWNTARKDIVAEFSNATNVNDRVACLILRHNVLNMVERHLRRDDDLWHFREGRSQEYVAMLMHEALIGRTDSVIDPRVMLAITTREIRDGRMAVDDEIHKHAMARAMAAPMHASRSGGFGGARFNRWLAGALVMLMLGGAALLWAARGFRG